MKCLNEHTKIRGIRVFDTFYLVILIYIYYTYLLSVILFFTFFIFLFNIVEKFFNVEY